MAACWLASCRASLCFSFSTVPPRWSWLATDPCLSTTCLMAHVFCLIAGPLFAGEPPPRILQSGMERATYPTPKPSVAPFSQDPHDVPLLTANFLSHRSLLGPLLSSRTKSLPRSKETRFVLRRAVLPAWNPTSPPSQANTAPTYSSGFTSDLSLRKPFLTATSLSFHPGRVRFRGLP